MIKAERFNGRKGQQIPSPHAPTLLPGARFCDACRCQIAVETSGDDAGRGSEPAPSEPSIVPENPPRPNQHHYAQDDPDRSGPEQVCRSCGEPLPARARYCFMCSESVAPRGKSYWLSRCNSKGVCGGFPLRGDEAVIGKAADADIRIDGDDYVSRRHARLVRSDGMLYVEDLQSANGTFLKIRRPIPLAAGDEIQIGNSIFRLRESEL